LNIDEIDSEILKRILVDARLSYRKIANQIGASAPTVLPNKQTSLPSNNQILFRNSRS
jgi:AsnC-type helix-turn-helix domain